MATHELEIVKSYKNSPSDLELNRRARERRDAFKHAKRERKGFVRTSLAIGALLVGFGAEEAITNKHDATHYDAKVVHVGDNEPTIHAVRRGIGDNDNVLEELHRIKQEYGTTDLQGQDIVVHDD